MKCQRYLIILSAGLLAGCRTDQDPILFSSEPSLSRSQPVISPVTQPEKLSKSDLFLIKLAIYGYLLQRHFWDDHEYTAVFLQGEDDEVATLIKQFPNHVPPLKMGEHAQLLPSRTPVDKDTGRPAMILSVDALDPVDGKVQAIGKWYAGGAVSGFYTFTLQKFGDDWVIESSK